MISIPALAEKDLGDTVEGEFGIPVVFKTPNGCLINTTVDGKPLKGFVRRSYPLALEHGEKTTINSPAVKLRIASLPEIPESGALWLIGIPENPNTDAEIDWFHLDPKMPVEIHKNRGTVKLYLAKLQGGIVCG